MLSSLVLRLSSLRSCWCEKRSPGTIESNLGNRVYIIVQSLPVILVLCHY